jgi:pimeloyl-ACP methyl ester carboxylesterase
MPILRAYDRFLQSRFGFDSGADEIHRVRCEDGSVLALKRFLPAEGAPTREHPVLCVPGLGADSHNFDCPDPYGLAPYFARQGFDTWVVDLKGTGLSSVDRRAWSNITFDHMLADVPDMVRHVLTRSAAKELLWVGHSMGGMLLYAALGTGRAHGVRAAVTLASPLGFPQGWAASPALGKLNRFVGLVPGLYVRGAIRRLMPVAFGPRDATSRRYAVLDYLDIEYARRLTYMAVQDVPRGLAAQFRDWLNHDVFRSSDKRVDYRARLAGARLPILLVCATGDELGHPDSVKRGLDLLERATYLEAGLEGGFSYDYGHCDLVFGVRAPDEVFPRLRDYLVAQDELPEQAEAAVEATPFH